MSLAERENMLRDSKLIYHNKPYDESLLKQPTEIVSRTTKRSEQKAELEKRIRLCQWQLKNAGPWMSQEMRATIQAKLDKYKRQLVNLPEQVTHKAKKTYKKLSQTAIREYVMKWIEDTKAKGHDFIMAEDIAYQLQVKTHFVKQVLQQLNVEGILHQPRHHAPHDSKRDLWGGFADTSMWCPSVYYIREKEEEEVSDGLLE